MTGREDRKRGELQKYSLCLLVCLYPCQANECQCVNPRTCSLNIAQKRTQNKREEREREGAERGREKREEAQAQRMPS